MKEYNAERRTEAVHRLRHLITEFIEPPNFLEKVYHNKSFYNNIESKRAFDKCLKILMKMAH